MGNSMAVIIPKDILDSEKIKENDSIEIILLRDSKKVLEETFGTLKTKKSAQKIKDELRRELYDEDVL
jgi:antitoxin component of MazEF toxin-antitoxin module